MHPFEARLCEILNARSATPIEWQDVVSDVPLGGAGLGFDSIVIAEVLLDCETHFGISPLALLDEGQLTTARLLAHVRAANGS